MIKEEEKEKSLDELEEEIYSEDEEEEEVEEEGELEEEEEKEEKEEEKEEEIKPIRKEEIKEMLDESISKFEEKYKREPTKDEKDVMERFVEEGWKPVEGNDAWNQVAEKIIMSPKTSETLKPLIKQSIMEVREEEKEELKKINENFDAQFKMLRDSGEEISKEDEKKIFELALNHKIGNIHKPITDMTLAYSLYKSQKEAKGAIASEQKKKAAKVGGGDIGGEAKRKEEKIYARDVAGKTIDDVLAEEEFE